MSNSLILNRGPINNIHTTTIVGDYNYEANLRGIINIISKRGICKYHNLK